MRSKQEDIEIMSFQIDCDLDMTEVSTISYFNTGTLYITGDKFHLRFSLGNQPRSSPYLDKFVRILQISWTSVTRPLFLPQAQNYP